MALTSVAVQGQIWYCNPDVDDDAKTRRMKKIRPWIIISPDKANFSTSSYIGLPITHTANENDEFRISIKCPTKPGKTYSKSWIIPYKPREIDEQDLINYLGAVDPIIVSQCIEHLHQYLLGNITNKLVNNSLMNIDDFIYESESSSNILNIADIKLKTVEPVEVENTEPIRDEERDEEKDFYLKLHPNAKYYDKYKDIKCSTTVSGYISLYKTNKTKFQKEFGISSKAVKTLYNELINYYDWLMNKLIKNIV